MDTIKDQRMLIEPRAGQPAFNQRQDFPGRIIDYGKYLDGINLDSYINKYIDIDATSVLLTLYDCTINITGTVSNAFYLNMSLVTPNIDAFILRMVVNSSNIILNGNGHPYTIGFTLRVPGSTNPFSTTIIVTQSSATDYIIYPKMKMIEIDSKTAAFQPWW